MAKISRRAVTPSPSISLLSSASTLASSASLLSPSVASKVVAFGATITSSLSTSSNAVENNAIVSSTNKAGGTLSVNAIIFDKAASGTDSKYTEPNSGGHFSSYSTSYSVDSLHDIGVGIMDVTSNGSKGDTHFEKPLLPTFTPTTAVPYVQSNKTDPQLLASERERIRAEFFATYDVMTGVRIAATLGGFFGLMVFLIVWKSRSSSNETLKVLKDPKMAAVAAVCMQEEEEREIQEAMVATGMSIYPDEYDAIVYRRQRMLSLGNVSAPPMLNRGFRFSSVGGGEYRSLLEPPRRFSYSAVSGGGSLGADGRRKSGSESLRKLSNYRMGSSFGTDDYFIDTEDEIDVGNYLPDSDSMQIDVFSSSHKHLDPTRIKPDLLEVPLMGQYSRRSSAMTCCSTESSYLERRCSAFTLGLGHLPSSLQRKLSTTSRASSTNNWDYYYPDIHVIQPTPKNSPCPSDRNIYSRLPPTSSSTTGKMNGTTEAPISVITSATKLNANNNTNISSTTASTTTAGVMAVAPTFIRKHSIAYYDPESAQAGRKQEIHSISADTVDVYPYNQPQTNIQPLLEGLSCVSELLENNSEGATKSAPPVGTHQGFHFTDTTTEELRLSMRRKIAVMELTRMASYPIASIADTPSTTAYDNNKRFPYINSATAIAATSTTAATGINSSSISVDSTPASLDKLNGSGSLGTISAMALFNMEKRAPLASLSSFKISSLEYQDSEMQSLNEDSVFLESATDTDEDMQQLSSDSEEAILAVAESDAAAFMPTDHDHQQQQQNLDEKELRLLRSHINTQVRHHKDKRYSLDTPNVAESTTASTTFTKDRWPLLQRPRTMSNASSSDRIALIGQKMREFSTSAVSSGKKVATPQPLETHFGMVISTASPPMHLRRGQLLQQYSDPTSLPTTTTEEDTCSTLNTEVSGEGGDEGIDGDGAITVNTTTQTSSSVGEFGDAESTTNTQYNSLSTVVSAGHGSSNSGSYHPDHSQISCADNARSSNYSKLQKRQQQQQQHLQLRSANDPCASFISDSIATRSGTTIDGGGGSSSGGTTPCQPLICMPPSLKSLILRGSSSFDKLTVSPNRLVSRSTANMNLVDAENSDVIGGCLRLGGKEDDCGMPSVSLELPLIKLQLDGDEEDESNSASSGSSNVSDAELKRSGGTDSSSRDPSLPSSTRKWSKETLF